MLNPTITWTDIPSDACSELRFRPCDRSVTIRWRSGKPSTHPCRRRDMLRLLDPRQSVGQWVNLFVLRA